MTNEVTERVLWLFKQRLDSDPDISAATSEILLTEQRTNDFGKDDEILTDLVETFEKRQ